LTGLAIEAKKMTHEQAMKVLFDYGLVENTARKCREVSEEEKAGEREASRQKHARRRIIDACGSTPVDTHGIYRVDEDGEELYVKKRDTLFKYETAQAINQALGICSDLRYYEISDLPEKIVTEEEALPYRREI
jgi:hypothetical protein